MASLIAWSRIGKALAAALGIAVLAIIVVCVTTMQSGVSARSQPTRVEATIARMARHFASPSAMRAARNAVPLTPAVLAQGRAHWADHCAACHGNDGKGTSGIGALMYPKTPDMTLAGTQALSDGELFAIIENGVRLTGMPAFGDGSAQSARETWPLVHFIRHLPKLTAEEIEEMEKLNPKTAEEWQQLQQESAFLSGGDTAPPPPRSVNHHHI
jgi:mono/diheme cytochrome c family protein